MIRSFTVIEVLVALIVISLAIILTFTIVRDLKFKYSKRINKTDYKVTRYFEGRSYKVLVYE